MTSQPNERSLPGDVSSIGSADLTVRYLGRTAKADRLAAIAEGYYHAAPDDDDEPEAAAMAMPVPRPRINTNAVSTTRGPKPPADEPSGLVPSAAH